MSKIMAKFNLGDRVRHVQHGYLAVVVDIDPIFQASGRYNPRTVTQAFATKNPWYRLLVDETNQMTYVEEDKLLADKRDITIENPGVDDYLTEQDGVYRSNLPRH